MKVFLWIIAIIALARLVHFLWRAYTHPVQVLARQAANMNWVATGTVKDIQGVRHTRFGRDGMDALVSYTNRKVVMIKPFRLEPFADFIEVERWLAVSQAENIKYCQAIEDFVRSHGWYDRQLMLQGTDPEFCNASLSVYSAGYRTKQASEVVGALLMEGVNRYEKVSRALGIAFLEAVEKGFHEKTATQKP